MKTKQVKMLQDGYAMKIKDYQDFPFAEIKEVYRPDINYVELAELLGVHKSTMYILKNKTQRVNMKRIAKYLDFFGIEMILLKRGKYFRDELDIKDLIIDPNLATKTLGLGVTYFRNEVESSRIDIYLEILEYLGLEMAIMEKGD